MPYLRTHPTVSATTGAVRGILVVAAMLFVAPCLAEESGSRKGHGHMSVSYQYISVDGFESSIGKLPIGTVDTHSINFDIEYNVTERLTLAFGIPYVIKRYKGPVSTFCTSVRGGSRSSGSCCTGPL